jgi:hypothetical protein
MGRIRRTSTYQTSRYTAVLNYSNVCTVPVETTSTPSARNTEYFSGAVTSILQFNIISGVWRGNTLTHYPNVNATRNASQNTKSGITCDNYLLDKTQHGICVILHTAFGTF